MCLHVWAFFFFLPFIKGFIKVLCPKLVKYILDDLEVEKLLKPDHQNVTQSNL